MLDRANSSEHGDEELNSELGKSYVRLPVSHTHTVQHAWQPGLWFFYMRGCSDFYWDVGRTLLVRNRCHLAGILEQRAHKGLGWDAAIGRVARRLVLAGDVCSWSREYCVGRSNFTWAGANSMLVEPLKEIVYEPSKIKGQPPRRRAAGELAAALDLCARGVLAPDKDGRELGADPSSPGSRSPLGLLARRSLRIAATSLMRNVPFTGAQQRSYLDTSLLSGSPTPEKNITTVS